MELMLVLRDLQGPNLCSLSLFPNRRFSEATIKRKTTDRVFARSRIFEIEIGKGAA